MPTERATAPMDFDRAQVRRAFERAAATYDEAAVLQREVGQRMAERLGFVRMQPVTILDAGCGTGAALGELHARYPDARLIGLDLAFNMTLAARDRAAAAARSAQSLLGRVLGPLAPARELRPWCICGDIASLPIKPASIDLVWSNLTLQWVNDPTDTTVMRAKAKGLDVDAIAVPGDHTTSVPEAMRQAIQFFQEKL